jgi:hypothetical protein
MSADNKGVMDSPISMDMSLDDIEDLPGFVVFPSGAYHVVLENGMAQKDINNHKALEAPLKLVEVLEISEPLGEGEEQPKAGDVCTISFMLDNKFGVGKMKEFISPIAKKLGLSTVGDVVNQSKGLHMMIVIKRTYDKDKDRHYANFKKVELL